MIRVWSRTCEACGRVTRIYRHVSARAPRGVRCSGCGTEHPWIGHEFALYGGAELQPWVETRL